MEIFPKDSLSAPEGRKKTMKGRSDEERKIEGKKKILKTMDG